MAALPSMLATDRKRRGFAVGQASRRLGVTPQEYREFEASTVPRTWRTWDRIYKLYGRPQTFVSASRV